MEWHKHVSWFPEGTLIKFRRDEDMMGDLAETEFKVSSILGKGHNIVYKCLVDLPSSKREPDATSPLPASIPLPPSTPLPASTSSPRSPHHESSPSLKRKVNRWGSTGRFKKISKRTPKATATGVISGHDEEASAGAGEASGTTSVCVAAEEVCVATEEICVAAEGSGAMRGREFAIKIQYIPAKDYKNVKELSWVWNEFAGTSAPGRNAHLANRSQSVSVYARTSL
jgi:hypothetical protein